MCGYCYAHLQNVIPDIRMRMLDAGVCSGCTGCTRIKYEEAVGTLTGMLRNTSKQACRRWFYANEFCLYGKRCSR